MTRADAAPARAAGPLPARAEIAVVGAGIMGLGIAHNLALQGQRGIVVLDAHTLAFGASGRNGGGLRQQWSTELNIRLMQESIEICANFARQMGINTWMRRGGYLFLAREAATLERMERNVALQNRCDVPTRQITVDEVQAIVPEIDTGGIAGACFNPTDAIVFPWPFLWGYARAAARRGVAIFTETPVTAIDRRGDDLVLTTPRGALTAGRVVCAAGAWSPRVAALVGGALPDWPARHEILSTEPLKPFLKPMVSVLETGLYFSQSLRGEVVGGISLDDPRDSEVRLGSRLSFVERVAAGMIAVLPRLAEVKVVRQWAGPYDLSPDGSPIVGELPEVPGFFVCCGFSGHGFMMAPVVSRYYAEMLRARPPHALFEAWNVRRFSAPPAGGSPAREEMIIG
ncbi:MAG TPA: FAD-binding oxidoreductase [Polyangia bacterium]|nr:FAD-binding oxidoreductase [Polyangia bacterium]